MSAPPSVIEPTDPSVSAGAPLESAMFIGFAPAARWHQRNPKALHHALFAVYRDAPEAACIADAFVPRLPSRPVACHNLHTAGFGEPISSPRQLSWAVTAPWIAVDDANWRNALLFDIDHTSGPELAAALPPHIRPHLIVDPYSGRSHAVAFLSHPVRVGDGPGSKAQRFADVAQQMMAAALDATPLTRGMLMKNPMARRDMLDGVQVRRTDQPATPEVWNRWKASGSTLLWITTLGAPVVSLRDFVAELKDKHADAVKPTRPRCGRIVLPGPSLPGRNNALFAHVSAYARQNVSYILDDLMEEACRCNSEFSPPLPASEVRSTVKSIWRWMLTKFSGRRRYQGARRANGHRAPDGKRGRDREKGIGLTPSERQSLAGRTTAAARAAATAAKIDAAIARLHAAGKQVTQAAIATEAGIGIATVKRKWQAINAVPKVSFAVLSGHRGVLGEVGADAEPVTADDSGAADRLPEAAREVRPITATGDNAIEAGKVELETHEPEAMAKVAKRQTQASEQRQRHLLLPLPGKQVRAGPPAESGERVERHGQREETPARAHPPPPRRAAQVPRRRTHAAAATNSAFCRSIVACASRIARAIRFSGVSCRQQPTEHSCHESGSLLGRMAIRDE